MLVLTSFRTAQVRTMVAEHREEVHIASLSRHCCRQSRVDEFSSQRRLTSPLASGRSTSCTSTSRAGTEHGLDTKLHLHVKPTPTLAGMIVAHTEVEQYRTQPEPRRLNRACQLPALLRPPSVTEASMFAVLVKAGVHSCIQYSTGSDVIFMRKMRGACLLRRCL